MSFVSTRPSMFPEAKRRGREAKLEKTAKKSFFTPAGSNICRGFKEHDLITCESKVHVVVSLRS